MFLGRAVRDDDPAWLDDDRDKALAWDEDRRERCPDCGTPWRLAIDHELRDQWDADQWTCHPCRTRETKRESLRRQQIDMSGMKWTVTRRGAT